MRARHDLVTGLLMGACATILIVLAGSRIGGTR